MRLDDWLDIRQRHASGEAIKAIARDKGISRNTVRRALTSDEPPVRAPRPAPGSVVDAVEPAVIELLAADPLITSVEIARRLGWEHSMTVLKDRVRALRPRLALHGEAQVPDDVGPPSELSSFVGRGHELAAIRQALRTHRLVSLVGPGGVGKTRLAQRAVAAARGGFTDGVRTVELAPLRDHALLAQSTLDSLNVADGHPATGDPVPVLVDHLRHRDLLLVLDNGEHLLDAVASLVIALLGAAPRLRVLLTSRQALGVRGEHVVEVPPLGVPATMPADVAEALTHPAIALFVDRAASVLPGFALAPRTMPDVVELTRRLDGIPLAIELAAVRLRVLSVRQLLDRLEDRFGLLTGGDRAAPARHRTLQATIAWSYDLCTAPERALWSRAGVFPGTFDLEALDAVCTDPEIPSAALLDGVTGLAAKSILHRDEDHAGSDGGVRFRMLETVREFGHDQLPADLDLPLRSRHRDHYLAVVGDLRREWFGPDQYAWSRRMKAELPNLRAALDHSLRGRARLDPADGPAALRLVGEPWFLWAASVSMTEHRRWLQRALEAAPEPSRERVQALVTCALVASLQGDQAAAAVLVADGLTLARGRGDAAGTAFATHISGMVAFFSDDFPRAAELFGRCEQGYRETDAGGDLTGALDVHVGLLGMSRGRLEEAEARLSAARARSVEAGETWVRAYATDGLGFIALVREELGAARRLARESLELISRFDDTIGLSLALDLGAWTAAAGEEHERAAILLGAASARWRSFGAQLYGSPDWQARRDGYQERARCRLGDPTFEAAFRHGAAMSRPDMLGYALGRRDRPDLPGPMEALTVREREIARLVADGLTNRQIASRLVLSHRTVEGHVGRILGKLGFGRRTQLAAWVGRVPAN